MGKMPMMGGQMNNLVRQAQSMQNKISKMQEELATYEVSGTSGGGMVTAKVNGKQELLSLKIEKEVVNPDDIEMLQDLIMAAVKEAIKKSSEHSQNELNKITGGLSIPGLF
ncbi:MAG TPA: YbaB/EbfC family nucleoid-associated protein [Candidatus Wallbacteria bacterium]|nr:YbaB/EbfC family nucleoid-associated protein [Candidatus Wallbacteria bacterium]